MRLGIVCTGRVCNEGVAYVGGGAHVIGIRALDKHVTWSTTGERSRLR